MDGVAAFYSAKDIPGNNNFMNLKVPWSIEAEEFLCSGLVLYNGQPAGIVLADTFEKANLAAAQVKIEYARNGMKALKFVTGGNSIILLYFQIKNCSPLSMMLWSMREELIPMSRIPIPRPRYPLM